MEKQCFTTVVIADDHQFFRDGLKLVFTKENNLLLVGEASNGLELVELAKELMPKIIFTDIVMPKLNGIDATKKILSFHPDAAIIALSMFDEDYYLTEILEAGALGYILKNAGKEEILEAIACVKTGTPYYCDSVSNKIIELVKLGKFNRGNGKDDSMFTEKELHIIEGICKEQPSKEIASALYCSTRTIEWHRRNIMSKMKVKSPLGVVIYAIRNKLFNIYNQ